MTTGQLFLHSCRHFFGLHRSELTIAIRVNRSAIAQFSTTQISGFKFINFSKISFNFHSLHTLYIMNSTKQNWILGFKIRSTKRPRVRAKLDSVTRVFFLFVALLSITQFRVSNFVHISINWIQYRVSIGLGQIVPENQINQTDWEMEIWGSRRRRLGELQSPERGGAERGCGGRVSGGRRRGLRPCRCVDRAAMV